MQPWSMPAPWYWQRAVMNAHLQTLSMRPPPPPPPPPPLESASDDSSGSGSDSDVEARAEAAVMNTGPPSPSSRADLGAEAKVESLRRILLRMPFFASHRQSRKDNALRQNLATLIKVDASDDEGGGASAYASLAQVVDANSTPRPRPTMKEESDTDCLAHVLLPPQVARRAADGHATLEQVAQQLFASSRPRPSAKAQVKSEQMDVRPPSRRTRRGGKRGGRKGNGKGKVQSKRIPKWTRKPMPPPVRRVLVPPSARPRPRPSSRWDLPRSVSITVNLGGGPTGLERTTWPTMTKVVQKRA